MTTEVRDVAVAPPPVPVPAPRWDANADTDWRIYALVVLGKLIQFMGVATVVPIGIATWYVSILSLVALMVPLMLWTLGAELANARLWPDGSIYIRAFTRNAFIPHQPVGLIRQGNNCCINSALQLALASRSVRQAIEGLAQDHALRRLLESYRGAQAEQAVIATRANSQIAREFVADYALPNPRPARERDLPISRNSGRQEDAGSVLQYLLDALQTVATTAGGQRLPFTHQIVETLTRFTTPEEPVPPLPTVHNLDQPRLLLHLGYYLAPAGRGVLPQNLTAERAFLDYIADPYFNDQNLQNRVERRFAAPPAELFIQLNRFDGRGEKINDRIPMPEEFTLPDQYVQAGDGRPARYGVTRFLVHFGRTISSGHYVAYEKVIMPNGETIYWEIDDSHVTPLYQREWEAALKQAYNLHYARL